MLVSVLVTKKQIYVLNNMLRLQLWSKARRLPKKKKLSKPMRHKLLLKICFIYYLYFKMLEGWSGFMPWKNVAFINVIISLLTVEVKGASFF